MNVQYTNSVFGGDPYSVVSTVPTVNDDDINNFLNIREVKEFFGPYCKECGTSHVDVKNHKKPFLGLGKGNTNKRFNKFVGYARGEHVLDGPNHKTSITNKGIVYFLRKIEKEETNKKDLNKNKLFSQLLKNGIIKPKKDKLTKRQRDFLRKAKETFDIIKKKYFVDKDGEIRNAHIENVFIKKFGSDNYRSALSILADQGYINIGNEKTRINY